MPLKEQELARREMAADGCCLGMSFDFIARYLQLLEEGLSSEQAVHMLAPEFRDGATEMAELAQIFYAALDTSNMPRRSRMDERLRELEDWVREEREKIDAKDLAQVDPEMERIETAFQQNLQIIEREAFDERLEVKSALEMARQQVIAEALGLKLGESRMHVFHPQSTRVEALKSELNRTPIGVYSVDFCTEDKGSGHTIVWIRTREGDYLFEPNFGTLKTAHSSDRLVQIASDFYATNGVFTVRINPLTKGE